jgi:hypothetical protein
MRAGAVVVVVGSSAALLAGCGGQTDGATASQVALRTPASPATVSTAPGRCGAVVERTLHTVAARIEARAALHRSVVGRTPALVGMLTHRAKPACAPTPAATVANTIGTIARRLVRAEATGVEAQHALRVVTQDPALARAVRRRDPVALRAAVVRFFHLKALHIVRVRATTARGHLVGDVGGPFVLSPASHTIRSAGGRRLGRAILSIQDDAGFIKLMARFAGAGVVLRTAKGVVPGSTPAPRSIPASGRVLIGRRPVETYSFTTRAFPAGALHVTLLVPVTSSRG